MAPARIEPQTDWSTDYETQKRHQLFRNPPSDKTAYPALAEAIRPHVESFDAVFAPHGQLHHALKDIGTKTFLEPDSGTGLRNRVQVRVRELFLDRSVLPPSNKLEGRKREILPVECRERHVTYRGRFRGRLEWRVNDGEWKESLREFGHLPIMLRSNRCHLQGLSPRELVNRREETEELGGYFIVNGIEKLIRMLIVNRRNFPAAIIRPSFKGRGSTYTEFGVQIRSVRRDQTSQTNVLHYLNDGNIVFRFSWRKNEYLVPVMMILKALVETNDREIYEGILGQATKKGEETKQFVAERVELLLRNYKSSNLHNRTASLDWLGSKFRVVLGVHEDMSDEEAGMQFLSKIVLPHLESGDVAHRDADKFRMLLFMIQKLYALVAGDCAVDNPDAVQNQEILLPGALYGMIIKERVDEWLASIGMRLREWSQGTQRPSFTSSEFEKEFLSKVLRKTNENIGQSLDYFLSTGNLVSPSGLDLQQVSGFTVVAEKINFYRFISHFRMVHRGSFFAQLKTTTVRKLLPESWGFLCPVHTPDGAPCGLLNHLAHRCKVTTAPSEASALPQLLSQLGVEGTSRIATSDDNLTVQLDGRILGVCSRKQAKIISDTLRYWKVEGSHGVPLELEIGLVMPSNAGQYPGLYLFTSSARMLRPVKYLPLDKVDYVGSFEQPFMSVACTGPEIQSGDSTHAEYTPTNMLSIVANQTPFSDFNQSPRNMYQCQMGKQSMGTPGTALKYRTDNKLYRLQSGQTPVVRPPLHNQYGLDNFPNGTNAVVAVISYTGYDMDDAMILNKSAHERGFGHGTIYKTKKIDLSEDNKQSRGRSAGVTSMFGFAPNSLVKAQWRSTLDDDGFAAIGLKVKEGDIIAASHSVSWDPLAGDNGEYVNRDNITHLHRYKEPEEGFIEEIKLIGNENGNDEPCQAISIRIRIPRSPVIGDKFSSRHGQKGVCSQKWPAIDMPFTESGMQPDVIINPHAFPSRMTIGMFVESLAGKSGALHGLAQDSTPFRFKDKAGETAVEHFGHQLKRAGYNYYGNEPMYSGITGEELAADIYVGVVYYQRLRHMVNDKFQVRTTGPVTPLTGQPIKGRAKGGGIRVGEMERDSLIAHGTAFLLQDRLLNCSDYTKAWICRSCGSFLSVQPSVSQFNRKRLAEGGQMRCKRCSRKVQPADSKVECWEDAKGEKWYGGEDVTLTAVPGVLRYLDVELAAMGIRMKFDVGP
ncbi:DNA-directed RNA polymerase I [Neohortaea acidophila]|uniref:DNA-directed RNA polymerase subunit beta n=1 Tax=Neohortaea acidophila TaxID=245834 RepID=A0A6A6Q6C3_9PEZI|nr:DNA-directed RNA polymerase I [Neohortaea acidophila]KAF2487516.1 DNA-directed RNA polymerase I [Neohortaea acidophila]